MTQMVLPFTHPGSRIVSLSSVGSMINQYSGELQQRFRTVSNLAEVDELAKEYLQAVKEEKLRDKGWPSGRAYGSSKALINAFTRVLAEENKEVLVNCCCPGWVETSVGLQLFTIKWPTSLPYHLVT